MGRIAEVRKRIARMVYEALSGTALGDWGTGGDRELLGYTRLTGRGQDGKLLRDLTPMSQEQQTQVSHFLYASNPLGGWLVDQRVDLLLGPDLGYSIDFDAKKMKISPEKARKLATDAKDWLDQFWDHPAHSLRFRAQEYLTTLMVSGELCLLIANENEVSGVPELDYVDSQIVTGVLPLQNSSMVPGTVLIQKPDGTKLEPKTIVRQDLDAERLVGQCFYWRNGRVLNSMRGRSELFRPADFLDSLDQFMFSQVDRALLQNNVVWRLKLEGATDDQIKKRVDQLRGELGKPGGIFGHNEKGELVAAAPALGAWDTDLQRSLANHIRGSKSLPESWYGEGGNANRSTASDQTDVAYKSLEAWQTFAKRIFNTMLWYAYDNLQAKQEGAGFPKRSEGVVTLTVDMPPVRERDMGRAAETATKTEAALESAVEAQFISKKTARRVFLQVVEKISGVNVDPDDEEAQIEAEAEEREKEEKQRQADAARRGFGPVLPGQPEEDDGEQPQPKQPSAPVNGNGTRPPVEREAVHIHLPENLVRIPENLTIAPPAVNVTVEAPPPPPPAPAPQVDVHVPAAPAPVVVVQVPEAAETVDDIEYDDEGRPSKVSRRKKREDE